jgi:hypothetical protein
MEYYDTVTAPALNNKKIVLYWDGEDKSTIRPETGDERHDRIRQEKKGKE